MGRADAVYARLPVALQHAAVSAFGVRWRYRRIGGDFAEHRARYAALERSSANQWETWTDTALGSWLAAAFDAPHYSAAWSAAGYGRSDVAQFRARDLPKLPFTSKDDVRRSPRAFCIGGTPARGTAHWRTSGSTGTPIDLWGSLDDTRRALALRDTRYDSFAGVNWSMPRATFSGRRVEPRSDSRGPFYRINLAERQTYFSAYHVGPNTIDRYVEALWRRRPSWINGYSTVLRDIARLARERKLALPPMLGIVTIAEPVDANLRAEVEAGFHCRLTEEYALAEESCFALECERGSLHVCPDGGIVEIIDEQGELCPAGSVGEIVATGLVRAAQPFIRYRTGDLGALSGQPCACGREMPVLEQLLGRIDDTLIGEGGRRVGRLSGVPKGLPGVIYTQFHQSRLGAVDIRVVCDHDLQPRVRHALKAGLAALLGEGVDISVHQVASLERSRNGKIRTVISDVRDA